VRDPFPAAAPRRQLLGIRSGLVNEETRRRLRLPQSGGARVVSRVVGSPADLAAIPLESVIIAVDGQPVMSPTDLARLIQAAGPSAEVELSYISETGRHVARAKLADLSPRPLVDDARPDDANGAAKPFDPAPLPSAMTQRIEQLERRIRELEERVKLLEGASNPTPGELPAPGRNN
jgi:hypothetical protein